MNNVDFASYADDNTPFFVGKDLDDIISKLQNASKTLFQWFIDNQMSSSIKVNISMENQNISNSASEKLLGVFFHI